MSWRETRNAARRIVHATMAYVAALDTGTVQLTGLQVRWHRKQSLIGEMDEGYAAFVSDIDRIVFLTEEIPDGMELKRNQLLTLDDGTVLKIKLVYPEDFPTITCEVEVQ